MRRVSDVFRSFWQITTRVIFAKKAQVLFYYPQHFNRSAEGTNPFFDRLLDTCDRHGISYKLIEEPDWGTDKPRNKKAIKGDALFVLITVVRKVIMMVGVKDIIVREKNTARIVNVLTLGRFQFSHYITISGSQLIIFLYLNTQTCVYDMQHGILFKQHPTFFDEHEHLRQHIAKEVRWRWLLWGRGYERCFSRGEEELISGRIHVVGYPVESVKNTIDGSSEKVILFSLQFTHDISLEKLKIEKDIVEDALLQLKGKHVRVLLKHHPRYNNAIEIDDLLQKYPFAELTALSMQQLLSITMLQVTINSTTSFEYAQYGIPSYFIDKEDKLKRSGNLFLKEYDYPLYQNVTLGEVVDRLRNESLRQKDSEIVSNWYREFYDNFNEQEFLNVISDD